MQKTRLRIGWKRSTWRGKISLCHMGLVMKLRHCEASSETKAEAISDRDIDCFALTSFGLAMTVSLRLDYGLICLLIEKMNFRHVED